MLSKRSLLIAGAILVAVGLGSIPFLGSRGDEEPEPSPTESALTGVFTTEVSREDLKPFDYVPQKRWATEWTLEIFEDSYQLRAPVFRVTESAFVTETEMTIDAIPAPAGAFNCYAEDGARLTEEGEASATYDVSVDAGGTISLEAVEEPCDLREMLLGRSWSPAS